MVCHESVIELLGLNCVAAMLLKIGAWGGTAGSTWRAPGGGGKVRGAGLAVGSEVSAGVDGGRVTGAGAVFAGIGGGGGAVDGGITRVGAVIAGGGGGVNAVGEGTGVGMGAATLPPCGSKKIASMTAFAPPL